MAIKPPNWAKGAIPTPQGWKNKRTGELLVAQKISKSQIDEFFGIEPEIQTLTESPTTAEEAKEFNYEIMKLSGTEFRKKLRNGEPIPEWFAFKSVVDVLRRS